MDIAPTIFGRSVHGHTTSRERKAFDFIRTAIENEEAGPDAIFKVKLEAEKLAKKGYSKIFESLQYEDLLILHLAADNGYSLLTEVLAKHLDVDIDTKDNTGMGVLHFAATSELEKPAYMRFLVKDLFAHVDLSDNNGTTPLHMSIINGKNWAIDLLLQLGSNMKKDFFYGKATHAACAKNNVQALQMLIQRGADVDELYQGYLNPLAAAVYFGSIACLNQLLQVSSVNATPLISKAVISDQPDTLEMVQMLLENGADANTYNVHMNERIPIIAAAKSKKWDVVELLLQRTEPIQGVSTWDVAGISSYIQSADFKVKDSFDRKTNATALEKRLMHSLRRRKYLTAEICCKALKCEMDDEIKWDCLHNLCQYCISSAITGGEVTLTHDAIRDIGIFLVLKNKEYSDAIVALKAALALDPTSGRARFYLKEAIKHNEGVGTSGGS